MAISILENYAAANHDEVCELLRKLHNKDDLRIKWVGDNLTSDSELSEFIEELEEYQHAQSFTVFSSGREVYFEVNLDDYDTYTVKQVG